MLLRFGLPYVTVSDIVEQALCEHRIVLRYVREDEKSIRRRDLRRIIEATATLLSSTSASSGGCRGRSFTIAAVVEGVPIVGRPDLLLFKNGRLAGIVWSRVGGKPGIGPYDRLRLYLYGLIADYAGFDVSNTMLYLIVAPNKASLVDSTRLVYRLAGCTISKDTATANASIHRLVYDRRTALEYVGGLLSFWLSDREPRGPSTPAACRTCKYADLCSLPNRVGRMG